MSFRGAAGEEESRPAIEKIQSEIPSLRSGQALRCAQDDSEGSEWQPDWDFHKDSKGDSCRFDPLKVESRFHRQSARRHIVGSAEMSPDVGAVREPPLRI
ncbi:hypothetical protein SBA2_30128 [Acidobacteriia bacterium SbA2]|nr:hypothetical protein SBA2_30128 [Acidobacteriia bacterium SbA2]